MGFQSLLGIILCGNQDFMALLFCRTPLVSFLYERGWRQNFIWGGFPGPEKEVRRKSLSFLKGLSFAAIISISKKLRQISACWPILFISDNIMKLILVRICSSSS